MKRILPCLGSSLLLLACVGSARGSLTHITYDLTSNGAGTWTYDYTFHNDSLESGWSFVTLFFPDVICESASQFSNLQVVTAPNLWQVEFISASLPNQSPYADVSMPTLGIGDSQGGLQISFQPSGLGAPGHQFYEVYDTDYWTLMESGLTTPVPEPSTWLAGALLMFALAGREWRRRR